MRGLSRHAKQIRYFTTRDAGAISQEIENARPPGSCNHYVRMVIRTP